MKESFHANKLGVLGGGQLGRMLIQEAINYNLQVEVIDPDKNAPCKAIAHKFTHGKLTDFETILKFGREHELLTIEIENVNTDALKQLEKEGVKVFPQPDIIALIKNKVDQKTFYRENNIPTSPFVVVANKAEVVNSGISLPSVLHPIQSMNRHWYVKRGIR